MKKQTDLKTQTADTSVGSAIRRITLPFLLFTSVLLGLLLLSYYLLLPKLTQVKVAGKQHNTAQLKSYVASLEANVNKLEDERSEFVTPLRKGLYGSIKKEKFNYKGVLDLRSKIQKIALDMLPNQKNVVVFSLFDYAPAKHVLLVRGKIMNVGPRSMTLLAQFVDLLQESEWVEKIDLPLFKREYDENKGYYSPFEIYIYIK